MGIVWLARDEELEREVALKFLPDLMIQDRAVFDQLKRETKRSLELTHPHIVRIYDFIHDERSGCISMEFVDGETLASLRCNQPQQVFEPSELSAWTSQICDALEYAHNRARIIHRDLKPANLMVNQRGEVKVSDFGIARSLSDSVSRLTMEQGRSGTLVYMSPQQLDGEPGTHLDDIYSLGATLYDLLTGKPPFYSGNIDRQIHERVAPSMTERRKDLNIEPALVPPVWEDAVAACLAKDPTQRPQSAAEVAQRLQLSSPQTRPVASVSNKRPKKKLVFATGIAVVCVLAVAGLHVGLLKRHGKPVAHPGEASSPQSSVLAIPAKSIAVLPFENRSEDKANAYFADGIQDEILTRLSKIADLKVISRTSTQHYKSAPENLPEIAKQLGVAHVLEGSVQKSGDAVRVNVQLIKAANDSHLWADTYDRKLTDIFSVESEVAKAIADQLRAKLTGQEEQVIAVKPTDNPEAYDAYLRGLAYTLKTGNTPANALGAQKYLREAVRWTRSSPLVGRCFHGSMGRLPQLPIQPVALRKRRGRQPKPPSLARLQSRRGRPARILPHACLSNYDTGMRYFEQNTSLPPNSTGSWSLAFWAKASHWDQSEALREAERLTRAVDCSATAVCFSTIVVCPALRKFDQVLDITPDDLIPRD
jgi:serine/threonine protein kinase